MTEHDHFIRLSRTAFLANHGPTLEDVRTALRADTSLEPVRKRDMLSGLRRIEVHADRPISEIPATAPAVRELFEYLKPARMDVSDKSFRNVRSLVIAAARRHGGAPKPITRRNPLSSAWKAVLEQVPVDHVRQGLHRLNAFRSLVDKIVAYPAEKRGQFDLELHGQIVAAINLGKYGNSGGGRGTRTPATLSG